MNLLNILFIANINMLFSKNKILSSTLGLTIR